MPSPSPSYAYTLAAWPCEPAPLHWARPARAPLPAVATAAPAATQPPAPADALVRAMVAELAALPYGGEGGAS